jgi:hypothetical protein
MNNQRKARIWYVDEQSILYCSDDNRTWETELQCSIFPCDLRKRPLIKGFDTLRTTPFKHYFMELAMKAVENEDLGKDDVTDFQVSFFPSTASCTYLWTLFPWSYRPLICV